MCPKLRWARANENVSSLNSDRERLVSRSASASTVSTASAQVATRSESSGVRRRTQAGDRSLALQRLCLSMHADPVTPAHRLTERLGKLQLAAGVIGERRFARRGPGIARTEVEAVFRESDDGGA